MWDSSDPMPTIVETLQRYTEPLPDWLQQAAPFDRERFFGSRTVYYPGSGIDGHPVEICAPAHAAHAFVYVDYGVPKDDIRDRVHGVRGKRFLGYEVEHEEDVQESALPGGWVPHVTPSEAVRAVRGYQCFANIRPFAWYVVLRREKDRDHAHGPARLALLFVGGDGFATFDALYCQKDGTNPPFLAVLQDHGFGWGFDRFCAGGLLERIASRCGVYPEWLLVGQNGNQWNQWEGYADAGAEPDPGGMHNNNTPRKLFRRAPTASANASPTKFSSTSQTLTGWWYESNGDG